MTNREFINQLTNEEFADCIIHEDFLHMPCTEHEGVCNEGGLDNCSKCIAEWLNKEVTDERKESK